MEFSSQIGQKSFCPKHFIIIGSIAAVRKPLNKKVKKYETDEIMTGGIVSKPFNKIVPIEKKFGANHELRESGTRFKISRIGIQ